MPITFLNRTLTAARAFDSDVLAWEAAVIAHGGTVSLARRIVVDQFVFAEKSAGLWALTDDYLGFWAENEAQGLTSLKQHRLATFGAGTPTFLQNRHYAFNAANCIDTGFVPGTHAAAMTANSIHAEIYERTSTDAAADAMGTFGASSRVIVIQPRTGGAMNAAAGSNAGGFTLISADSRGLSQVGRSGATTGDQYGARNGVDLAILMSPTALGATLSPLSIFVGGSNNGALVRGRACSVGYVAWGAALNSAQRLARYNNVQAWATSVGAQV